MSVSTRLAASSVECEQRSPWIPPELISLIFTKFWEAPLSERSASLQNIVLVNRTWLALMVPIAVATSTSLITETHIISSISQASGTSTTTETCLRLRQPQSSMKHVAPSPSTPTGTPSAPTSPNPQLPSGIRSPSGSTKPFIVPWKEPTSVYDDIILQAEYAPFPRQVTHLSVDYSFTASAPPFNPSPKVLDWTRTWYRYSCFSASIRRLSLSGMPEGLVAIMVQLVCPKLETLELAHPIATQLAALAPLPPTMRTLVLCYPGVTVGKEMMASWALDAALNLGLFPNPKGSDSEPRRIIIRSGTPDPAAFTELKRTCQHEFGVELVYERDDSRTGIRAC